MFITTQTAATALVGASMRADLDGGDYVAFAPPPTRGFGLLVLTFVCGLCLGLAGDRLLRPVAATPSVALVAPANNLMSHTFDRPAPSHKFGVEGVTPVALQMARGTCWIFAAVAVLEHSYRMQGMEGSYLQSDEYLRLSEQVFGISILDSCAKLSDESCLIGDEVWVGNQLKPVDTQGGSASLLFWLKRLETTAAMPNSVCNYTSDSGHDHLCPGLDSALAHSPLSFQTVSITTLFDREDIKSALRRHKRVMSLSTGMVTIRYLIPCTKDTALALQCDPTDASTCMACPFEPAFGGVSCCVSASRESNTMRGEFYRLPPVSHPPPIFEGGHAMALVGYSDTYRTAHGFVRGAHQTPAPKASAPPHACPLPTATPNPEQVGGYILKNSWWDGLPPGPTWKHARGSHSLGWFLQDISLQDEARLCPNAHSPESWFGCSDLASCRDRKTRTFAHAMNRPLHLECIDSSPFLQGMCASGEKFFLQGIHSWGAGLSVGCFLRDDGRPSTSSGEKDPGVTDKERFGATVSGGSFSKPSETRFQGAARVCSPPVPVEDLALVFQPIEEEQYLNHPDLCGFYFFPYELADTIRATGDGSFEVDDFEIKWSESSYAANAEDFPDMDYTLVKADTLRQEQVVRAKPFLRPQEDASWGRGQGQDN